MQRYYYSLVSIQPVLIVWELCSGLCNGQNFLFLYEVFFLKFDAFLSVKFWDTSFRVCCYWWGCCSWNNFSENNLVPLSKHRLFEEDILYFECDKVVKLCYEPLSASVMLTVGYLWHDQLRTVVFCNFWESSCSKTCLWILLTLMQFLTWFNLCTTFKINSKFLYTQYIC